MAGHELFLNLASSNRTVYFPGTSDGKESACQCRRHKKHRFDPWVGKIPWRRKWQPTPVFLPGESPWTEEPSGLQSMGLQRVRHDRACITTHHPMLWTSSSLSQGLLDLFLLLLQQRSWSWRFAHCIYLENRTSWFPMAHTHTQHSPF